ncbi:MAG: arsenate reductase ArsC [Candidatus Omnitrophica bacterium]|jgi:arsenate reductase|nr:arsenate reductase ArsC [Candidatus Omnitrophota bacterium]MDD5654867.1 arsenate reductase ArsC [Candidatus Omnitrophota bacterium]
MKKVLFVCVENSCRSQMAEGFARQFGKDVWEVYSAGSKPSGVVNPDAVKVMREAGIDISLQESKGFSGLPVREFDYVITLGCQDICPFVPAVKHLEWQIEDPKGRDLDFFRFVRDNIKLKVQELIAAEREEK